MLFSIIIPTYNGEKTIKRLLTRLLSLKYIDRTEIIIIDSQSTDNTLAIVQSYQMQFPVLRILSIPRQTFNHAHTRNMAVENAKGTYLCFLSQDALPINSSLLSYYLEDFHINHRVVAVFGKHIPFLSTPLIQRLEVTCQWKQLDTYINNKGFLIQYIAKPFLPYTTNNLLLWYRLSNTSSCYKKSFLLKNPFPSADYGEDLLLGKLIIEQNFMKMYDTRCAVYHSHNYSLREYIVREKKDLNLRYVELKLCRQTNVSCKLTLLLNLNISLFQKLYYLGVLIFYYVVKAMIIYGLL